MTDVERIEGVFLAMSDRAGLGRIIEEGTWTLLHTPDARSEFRNRVLRASLAPDEVDRHIDAALERFGDLPFRWHVGPSCSPPDLGERLLARGFVFAETLDGLIAESRTLMEAPAPDLVVEEVLGEGPTMEEWLETTRDAWDMTEEATARFRTEMQVEFARENTETLYFLVRMDGRAVGTSGVTVVGDTGHLSGSCVLPEFRGRGAYRAMLKTRARVMVSDHIERITVMARASTSSPILQRLSFEKVCSMEVYAHRPTEG